MQNIARDLLASNSVFERDREGTQQETIECYYYYKNVARGES